MKSKKNLLILVGMIFFLLTITVFFSLPKKAGAPADNSGLQKGKLGENQKCRIENCHGMDISCGPNVPEMCTEIYQIGDGCRSYAKCQVQNGECQLVKRKNFDECKNCVEKCIEDSKNGAIFSSDCERKCHLKINGAEKPELM